MMPSVRRLATLIACLSLNAAGGAATPEEALDSLAGPSLHHFFCMNASTAFHEKYSGNPEWESKVWETLDRRLKLVNELGATDVRSDMWWSVLEPEVGKWNWEFSDELMQHFADAGVDPLVFFAFNPAWDSGQSPVTDKTRTEFGDYVFNTVSRYKGTVTRWEIWNEPNINPFWVPTPNAKDYTELAKVAYRRAKEADPNGIVSGIVAASFERPFIEGCYEAGIGDATDRISHHTYNAQPQESRAEEEIRALRRIMERHGDGAKPIIITESGISTGHNAITRNVPREEQARLVAIKNLLFIGEGVQQYFYFKLVDDPAEINPDGFWGLVDCNYGPKPSFFAYQAMTARLKESRYLGRAWNMGQPASRAGEAEVQLYLRDDGEVLAVAWVRNNGEPMTIQLPSAQAVSLEDMDGKAAGTAEPNEGAVTVPIGPAPVYIRHLSPASAVLAAVRFSPERVHLSPGGTQAVEATFVNPTDAPISLNLNPLKEQAAHAGLIAAGPDSISCDAGGAVTATVELSLPKDCAAFDVVRLTYNDSLRSTYCLPVYYEKPFDVVAQAAGSGGTATVLVTARGMHDGDAPEGSVAWSGPGMNSTEQASPLVAAPGNEMTATHPVADVPAGESEIVTRVTAKDDRVYTTSLRLYGQSAGGLKPVVDGNLAEWKDVPGIRLSAARNQSRPDRVAGLIPEDRFSGSVKVLWGAMDLYLCADITDSTPMIAPETNGDMWRGDGMELYLGLAGPTLKSVYSSSEFQIGLTPGDEGRLPVIWNFKSGKSPTGAMGNISGARIASSKTATGYTIEASIPLAEFGAAMPKGIQPLGFDVRLNNRLDRGDVGPEEKLIWNGTEDNFRDPSRWGLALPINK